MQILAHLKNILYLSIKVLWEKKNFRVKQKNKIKHSA